MKIKSNFNCLYILLAGCLMATPISAQQTYTLDECLQEALTNNLQMKNAENNLAIARQERQEAFTQYFPSLSASGSGFIADNELIKISMGGEQQLALLKNGVIGGVTATMPIFTGGQILNGNKLAKVNVEVNQLKHRQSENEIKLTTEQYFWQIVMLEEKLKTLSTLEEQLESLHKDVEASVNAGVTNRNDLLQVKLRKNETISNQIEVEHALSVSRSLLAQYIGHPEENIEVAVLMNESLPETPTELWQEPETSLPLTSEYNLLQENIKASRLQYRTAVGKNLPSVAIGGGFMYENLLDRDHTFWAGFLTVSVPLSGWWGGSHNMKKYKLQVRNAENLSEDQSQLLIIQMQNTWNGLNDAYKQVEIALESIGQATENLRLQTDYYHAGTCTMSDLLEAQSIYQQSRDQYVESYAQYEVRKREYLQATGR